MAQRSNMTEGYKGMRKGISLVEMLTAIILFGLISVISYNYYKNYYDTSFAAKSTRVYAIIDQATQLTNAYDLYVTKVGSAPATIQKMVDQKILTAIPLMQPVTTTGWDLNKTMDLNGTNNDGIAFTYSINANSADYNLTNQDRADYCNILNNAMKQSNELNISFADLNTSTADYVSNTDVNATFFCVRQVDDNSTLFVFIKADET